MACLTIRQKSTPRQMPLSMNKPAYDAMRVEVFKKRDADEAWSRKSGDRNLACSR